MPIDWNQVETAQQGSPPTGSIDWGAVSTALQQPSQATADAINNDAISQGARANTSQPSDALGGVSQAALDLLSAAGHSALKPIFGIGQLAENALAKGADIVSPSGSGWNAALQDAVAKDNATLKQWEQQYQQSTPDNAASYAGATIGSIAPMAVGGVAGGLQGVGDYVASKLPDTIARIAPNLLPKIISGATQGALVGAASPVDNGADYWSQKAKQLLAGGAVGGAVPVAAKAVQGVANAALPWTNPYRLAVQGLNKMGVNPAALDQAEIVPGSQPTTAQLSGNPSVIAAEKTLLANNPSYRPMFDDRNVANNAARWDVIQNVAKSPQALDAAIKARGAQTGPLIDKLLTKGNPVVADPVLDQLDQLMASPLGQRPTIGAAAKDIYGKMMELATPDANGNFIIPAAHLDAFRQNVKDYLAKYAPNGAVGSQEQAAFEPVRSAIMDSIELSNPGYRNYLAKYAQLSQPINTMEAGQSIVDNLGNRALNAGGSPQLTLGAINTQLKQIGNTPYGISPDAQKALEGVQADLQRATISNSIRTPGSDTAYNLQAPNWLGRMLYGQNYQGSGTLGMLGRGIGLVGGTVTGGPMGGLGGYVAGKAAGNAIANSAAKRINDAMAQVLLNPAIARQVMLNEAQTGQSALTQRILQRLPQAALVTQNMPLQAMPVPIVP